MAKRFTSITKPNKKLKLDVSVGAGHFCTNASNIADLWGSDDDDFILLATQIEEKNPRPPDDGSRHKDGKLSFSQFVPQANDNTSTQQFGEPMTTTSSQCPMPTSSSYQRPNRARDDEMLMSNILSELVEDQTDLVVDGIGQWTDYSTGQATANMRQLAQERQLKFLMERVDVLKKENTKLQKDIIDHNNQTLTKEGQLTSK
ncbi:ATR-interacting protein mus304 isoform X2 [Drosophila innubila]|uniref:ATR-interacting protein mus304 isoform X2 n=1 Tax=Drosophila innubila TaxID=198719 RepID=UPI00148D8CD7|nr:ATR-interacting protein mus304 isoform X2 [Drosophila innubila]